MLHKEGKKVTSFSVNETVKTQVVQSSKGLADTPDNLEQVQNLQQQVTTAYSEYEHENDDKIIKMQRELINRALASILEAERKNEQMVSEMVSTIPSHAGATKEAVDAANVLKILSEKLASELK